MTRLVGQTAAAHLLWLCTQHQHHLHVTVLMHALAFSEFAWLWISTKSSSVCRVTVMQLNAEGPGCKPQGANCSHVLDSGKHVLGLRLSATPSDHAFRPRFTATPFSHVFQPRLPAMSSDVPFGSRTLYNSAELSVPLDTWRCAALSFPHEFSLAADGKDKECDDIVK